MSQLGDDVMDITRRVKAALDPDGILNPGKWVSSARPTVVLPRRRTLFRADLLPGRPFGTKGPAAAGSARSRWASKPTASGSSTVTPLDHTAGEAAPTPEHRERMAAAASALGLLADEPIVDTRTGRSSCGGRCWR